MLEAVETFRQRRIERNRRNAGLRIPIDPAEQELDPAEAAAIRLSQREADEAAVEAAVRKQDKAAEREAIARAEAPANLAQAEREYVVARIAVEVALFGGVSDDIRASECFPSITPKDVKRIPLTQAFENMGVARQKYERAWEVAANFGIEPLRIGRFAAAQELTRILNIAADA